MALIPPCISAVTACARELGRKTAWGYAGMQMLFAFLCAYLVYFFLAGGAGVGMAVLLAIGAYVLGRKLYKQTRRKKNAAEKGPRAAKRLKTSGRT